MFQTPQEKQESQKAVWLAVQNEFKSKMILEDKLDFTWPEGLKRVAGVDISFVKGTDMAVACLAVLEYPSFKIIYKDLQKITMTLPYIPGFLAFRECPSLLPMFKKLYETKPELYPQLLMVDGNGRLHPNGFGLASHLGVELDLPTIGIGKNLHAVDGLSMAGVKAASKENLPEAGSSFPLVGTSGTTWGYALRATAESINPIFVSIGHRISLETALNITKAMCKFRVPEPVRMADQLGREFLR